MIIQVIDLNGNAPEFQEPLNAIVEDAKIGDALLILKAEDLDGEGYNKHSFNFTEEQILFELDHISGRITVKKTLLNKYGIHDLPVEVVDLNNKTLKSYTNVSINVLDLNINYPFFNKSQATKFKIYEVSENKV